MAVQAVLSEPVSVWYDTTEKSIRTIPDYTGLCRMRSTKRLVYSGSGRFRGCRDVHARIRATTESFMKSGGIEGVETPGNADFTLIPRGAERPGFRRFRDVRFSPSGTWRTMALQGACTAPARPLRKACEGAAEAGDSAIARAVAHEGAVLEISGGIAIGIAGGAWAAPRAKSACHKNGDQRHGTIPTWRLSSSDNHSVDCPARCCRQSAP